MSATIRDKNIEFSLANLEVFEDISIWAKYGTQGEVMDSKGNILEFPIKDGVLFDKDGIERKFEDIIKLPIPIFMALYPQLQITNKKLRTIIIMGVECFYYFAKSASQKIDDIIKTAQSMGQNPLQLVLKQTFNNNEKQPVNKYKIEVIGKIGGAVQQPQTPITTNQIKVDINKSDEQLTQLEQDLLVAINNLPQKITKEQFNKICNDNNISNKDRIDVLYNKYNISG